MAYRDKHFDNEKFQSDIQNFASEKNLKCLKETVFCIFSLKTAGDPPPCGFSKNVSSKERVRHWFFVTFNVIISHIFPEYFIEIPQVAQKL